MTKAIVCTVPKSGTYLLGAILTHLGMRDTKQHVSLRGFTDYSNVDLETARRNPNDLWVTEPLEATLGQIGPGEFAVGHLPSTAAPLLRDFKVIFAYRNIRDVLVSFCRWTADSGRWTEGDNGAWRQLPDGPDRLLGFLEVHGARLRRVIDASADWIGMRGVTQVSFEVLMGDYGREAAATAMRRIARAADQHGLGDTDLLNLLEKAKATQTITRSNGRSVRSTFWNDVVEAEFARRGFAIINSRLGFDEPSASGWWAHWWTVRKALKAVRFRQRAA